MTIDNGAAATAHTGAVQSQIDLAMAGNPFLNPTQMGAVHGGVHDTYSKAATLPGADLTAGGTRGLIDAAWVTDNTSASVARLANGICDYWESNNTPGAPAHGGTSVVSVTITADRAAMTAAINGILTDQRAADGWLDLYAAVSAQITAWPCSIVELINGSPVTFPETIT